MLFTKGINMSFKVGINGLGRIGRAVLRITLEHPDIDIVCINDINPDINNIAYLIKYDSTYGRLEKSIAVTGDTITIGNEKKLRVYRHENISDVPWNKEGVDIVIDSSGVKQNLINARKLKTQGVRHCIVTNAPQEDEVDIAIILGVNHDDFKPERHFLISSSICDANAFSPTAHVLDKKFGIKHGFLTTLHPWLNYQNLLDGPSISYATPGKIHDHYALGRGSTNSLIPKTTSAISASCKVLKNLTGKFLSMSYRIPTMIVSSADLSVELEEKVNVDTIQSVFEEEEKNQKWNIFFNNKEALVSTDFTGSSYSAVIDHRWIYMNEHNYLKMVLWYDNEWGYSSRVVDLVRYIGQWKN